MATRFVYVVGLAALLGCESAVVELGASEVDGAAQHDADAEVEDASQRGPQNAGRDAGPGDAGPSTTKPEDSSQSIGSPGAAPTCDEAQCAAAAADYVSALKTPANWWRTFEGGRCELLGIVGVSSGLACMCKTGDGGSISIGPKGAGCFYYGRAGDCLWDDSEYEPCSTDNDTCPARCEEFEARFEADAKRTFDAESRYSKCGDDGYCKNVVRVEGRCYADLSINNPHGYDCSLSDQQILASDAESKISPPVLSCSDPAFDGGICVDNTPPPSVDECARRPKSEWQGLLVCPPYPPCEESARCGLALACIDSTCQACTSDDQCAAGEGCALDHCMPLNQIRCHVAADCKKGQLCILSGYTGGTARANEDMRAYCLDPDGGTPQTP